MENNTPPSAPTPSELEILNILWRCREATAQAVHNELQKEKQGGYTGTLKLMQIMHQKGLLNRRREGRSHVYFPAIEESETRASLLTKFIDSAFGGSAKSLMMQLMGQHKVSDQELKDIRKLIERQEDGSDEPPKSI